MIRSTMRDRIAVAFGRALREERDARNLSQEKLSNEADVDRTFISQIERGKRRATLTTAYKLARARHGAVRARRPNGDVPEVVPAARRGAAESERRRPVGTSASWGTHLPADGNSDLHSPALRRRSFG